MSDERTTIPADPKPGDRFVAPSMAPTKRDRWNVFEWTAMRSATGRLLECRIATDLPLADARLLAFGGRAVRALGLLVMNLGDSGTCGLSEARSALAALRGG